MEGIHISLQPDVLGHVFGLPITNSLILTVITAVVLLAGGFFAVRSLHMVPGRFQNFVETIIETLFDFMANVLGDRKQALQFFPLVAAFFLFIVFNNWMGILPGVGSIVLEEPFEGGEAHATAAPLFRSANSDLNTTLALALVSVIATQVFAIRKLGVMNNLKKYFPFHQKNPVHIFVGLLEVISEFAKVLSFSFRLFGNIFAGEVLLITIMTLAGLIGFFVPLPFFMLELFVGFIQALVFAMLTLVFLKIATETAEH